MRYRSATRAPGKSRSPPPESSRSAEPVERGGLRWEGDGCSGRVGAAGSSCSPAPQCGQKAWLASTGLPHAEQLIGCGFYHRPSDSGSLATEPPLALRARKSPSPGGKGGSGIPRERPRLGGSSSVVRDDITEKHGQGRRARDDNHKASASSASSAVKPSYTARPESSPRSCSTRRAASCRTCSEGRLRCQSVACW